MKIISPKIEILDKINGDEILKKLEFAGRTCYKSEDKITSNSSKEFIKKAISLGHLSLIEHEKLTFKVVCDRGVTHEIVRHRLASYSQSSTRYCCYAKDKFGNEITVILPLWFRDLYDTKKQKFSSNYEILKVMVEGGRYEQNENVKNYKGINRWYASCTKAEIEYMNLIDLGFLAQQARAVLPNSLKTELVITMNMRELRYFLQLRTTPKCHPQVREITIPLLGYLKKKIPIIFDDINPSETYPWIKVKERRI